MRIDLGTAAELIVNYKLNQWQAINNSCPSIQNLKNAGNPTLVDSRSVWFSATELQGFLDDIILAGGNGIRFYYGAYTNDIVSDPQNAGAGIGQYNGLHTLVLIPTQAGAHGMPCDFNLDPDNAANLSGTSEYPSAMNHGSMAPPPWPPPPAAINKGAAPDLSYYNNNSGAYFLDL